MWRFSCIICLRTLLCDVTSLVVIKFAFVSCNQFSTWIACIGFTLGFGGMFLKTWRVHKIFVNRTKKMVSELKNYFHNELMNLEANNTRISLLVLGKESALDPRTRTKTSLSFVRERSGTLIFFHVICYFTLKTISLVFFVLVFLFFFFSRKKFSVMTAIRLYRDDTLDEDVLVIFDELQEPKSPL